MGGNRMNRPPGHRTPIPKSPLERGESNLPMGPATYLFLEQDFSVRMVQAHSPVRAEGLRAELFPGLPPYRQMFVSVAGFDASRTEVA